MKALPRRLPALEVVEVALVVPADLLDAVARELLQEGLGEDERHHGLAHHPRRGHRAHVTALHHRLYRFLGRHVHRAERLAQRGDGLHGRTHDDGLAIGDAALEAARTVRAPIEAAVRVEEDLVVHLGTGAARRLEAHADLGALDSVDGAEGPRESAVELAVPLHVGAEADGAVEGDDFEDAPQGVACRLGPIDSLDHGALGRGIGAADLRGFSAGADLFPRKHEGADVHTTDFRDVAQDGNAELAEDALGHACYRHAGGGLPRARALQHVAAVAVPVLHGPRQIGVPGPRPRHRLGGRARGRLAHRHGLLPILPVAVLDGQRDGAAEGHAPAHTGGEVGLVPLDLHAPAAAVAALAAPKIFVEVLFRQGKTGGHTIYDGGEGLAMGLSGGEEAKCHTGRYYFGATGVKDMPAVPWPVTIDGVTNTTSSRPVSLTSFCLKSQPRMGMSPKIGTLRTVLSATFWVTPPMTRRSPALIRTWVSALRLLMAGTVMPWPMLTGSPRELFSTSTTILILLTTVSPTCSRSTLGTTSSLSTASLNWICVPAELTVAYGISSPSEIVALEFSTVTISGRASVRVLP